MEGLGHMYGGIELSKDCCMLCTWVLKYVPILPDVMFGSFPGHLIDNDWFFVFYFKDGVQWGCKVMCILLFKF